MEILGRTESLCPACLTRLPAVRAQENGIVYLVRQCTEHGEFCVPVWRGSPDLAQWLRPKTPSRPQRPQTGSEQGCPFDCGLCPEHGQHTCTALIEVTQRCDLGCPVCFASSGAAAKPDPSLPELAARLTRLRQDAGACNLQLSGDEPCVRPDLPAIVAAARSAGFVLLQVNTNGLRLAREPGYAESLAKAGLDSVFLQFDGSDQACTALRGHPLLEEKLRAVEACGRAWLGVVLMPTLVPGVNDAELGLILDLALERLPVVRGVYFQPASSFGRFPWSPDAPRLTLPEVLTALAAQSHGLLRAEDFHPPCCEHEMCSFSGQFALEQGRLKPVSRDEPCCTPLEAREGARRAKAVTARQWAAADPGQPLPPDADDFQRFLAGHAGCQRLSLSCMAFQDAWTLDLEWVRGCCIHVAAEDGRRIPFCLYNLTSASGRTCTGGAADATDAPGPLAGREDGPDPGDAHAAGCGVLADDGLEPEPPACDATWPVLAGPLGWM